MAVALLAAAAAAALAPASPARAQAGAPFSPDLVPSIGPGAEHAHLFHEYYLTGMARLASGDPATARELFETAVEIAPDMPQLRFALAVSEMVADFGSREQALPQIAKALAAEPGHPLYRMARVIADPSLSVLKADGGLYLTPEGAAQVAAIEPLLAAAPGAMNGKYLAAWLGGIEDTSDPVLPRRLPGFAATLGKGCNLRLPQTTQSVALGRLFVQAVSERELQPYEAQFAERILAGSGYAKLPAPSERRSDLATPVLGRVLARATG